jgi:hypothetical protein
MALLATHPEEQENLYKELRSVMKDRDNLVSAIVSLLLV